MCVWYKLSRLFFYILRYQVIITYNSVVHEHDSTAFSTIRVYFDMRQVVVRKTHFHHDPCIIL